MSEIVAIVEGQTEQAFVRDHLAAYLGARGISIWPVLSGKSRKHGGVRKWSSAKGDILRTLREGRYVTTMFDFYAMPNDWPGRIEATNRPCDQRGDHVEQCLISDIAEAVGANFDGRQFIPYVQMHEFEALLFSDVAMMAQALAPVCRIQKADLMSAFQQILDTAGPAEAINDNYETCPSRRIAGIVQSYSKLIYGPIITGRIGLDVLRAACPHFGQWLSRLEAVG